MSVYANYADFTQTGTYSIPVPKSSNRIKVYLVGGGGGGGGGGGAQHNNRKAEDTGGGGGGSGSSGEIGFFTNAQSINGQNIKITVGSGGAGGGPGAKKITGKNDDKMKDKNGETGKPGINGNSTSVTIGNEKFIVNGGIGGNPGNGGLYKSFAGTGGTGGVANTYGTPGNPGKNGNSTNKTANGGNGGNSVSPLTGAINKGTFSSTSNTGIYPNTNPGQSGAGGEGGGTNTDAKTGANGNNGYARIYFLDN